MNNGHTHVLLIEDNPGDADLVRLRLVEGDSAISVSCVNRLEDGLASITKQPPSVVLLDLNLPDSHGADTFRKVLEKAPGMPVVILSGQDDEVAGHESTTSGCAGLSGQRAISPAAIWSASCAMPSNGRP